MISGGIIIFNKNVFLISRKTTKKCKTIHCSALAQNGRIKTSANGAYADGDVVMENKSNQVSTVEESKKAKLHDYLSLRLFCVTSDTYQLRVLPVVCFGESYILAVNPHFDLHRVRGRGKEREHQQPCRYKPGCVVVVVLPFDWVILLSLLQL